MLRREKDVAQRLAAPPREYTEKPHQQGTKQPHNNHSVAPNEKSQSSYFKNYSVMNIFMRKRPVLDHPPGLLQQGEESAHKKNRFLQWIKITTICGKIPLWLVLVVLLLTSVHMANSRNKVSTFVDKESLRSSTSNDKKQQEERQRPNGVFVLKATRIEYVGRTLCTLSRFFYNATTSSTSNKKNHPYPIRIFADHPDTNNMMEQYRKLYYTDEDEDIVDIQLIVDTEKKWAQLPSESSYMTAAQRAEAWKLCGGEQYDQHPEQAKCTWMKVPIGYMHMGYWRYMEMANEPALQDFEYFVQLDDDAFLTIPMPDPFEIMATNQLTGIFNIEAYQSGNIAEGIQQAAEAIVPSLEQRQNRYLDSPKFNFFDENGIWGGKPEQGGKRPSIWGCWYGGRLDFLRSKQFKDFAQLMVPSTHIYRTDEQAVIGAGWALLADNDKVWYLPKKGIEMGIFHHGWTDNRQIVRGSSHGDKVNYTFHELDVWGNFHEIDYGKLVRWAEYVDTLGYEPGDDWEKCQYASGKGG